MNRAERLATLAEEADEWFRPSGGAMEQPLVDWIPASSQVIKQLRADLEKLSNDLSAEPELRRRVRAVLSGEARLASVLEPGGFPVVKQEDLPKNVKEVIEGIREGDLN